MSEMNMTKERIFISIFLTYKITIKLTDVYMNINHNIQHIYINLLFTSLLGGRGGGEANFSLGWGGHDPIGPSLDLPLIGTDAYKKTVGSTANLM